MFDAMLFDGAARAVTYLIHSTIWLGSAWALTRVLRAPAVRQWTWRAAVCGGILTAALYGRFETARALELDVPRPEAAPASRVLVPITLVEPGALAEASREVPSETRATGATPSVWSRVRWYHGVGGLWAVGALVGLAQLGHQQRRVKRMLAGRRDVDHPALLDALERLRAAAGLETPVRLTWTPGLGSPIAFGRDEICIPERALTELSPSEQESMLAHELAHLARRDGAWLLGQALLERLFFFQPLNRYAAREQARAAEILCDEQAVRWTGQRTALARCLGRVAEWSLGRDVPLAAGMVQRSSPLVERIERVLNADVPAPTRSQSFLAGGWALAAAVLLACQGPGVARQKGEPSPAHPPQTATVDAAEEPTALYLMIPVSSGAGDEEWVALDGVIDELLQAWAPVDAEVERLTTELMNANDGVLPREEFEAQLRSWIAARASNELQATGRMRVMKGTLLVGDAGVQWTLRETGAVTSGIFVGRSPRQAFGVSKAVPEHNAVTLDVRADGSVLATIELPVQGTPGATMATGVQVGAGDDFAKRMHAVLKLAAEGMPKVHLIEGDDASPEFPTGRLLLRVDGRTDFQVVLTILEACGAEDVRIWNVAFELAAPDTEENEVATPLPRGVLQIEEGAEVPPRLELHIEVGKAGTKVDVESGEPWSGKGPFRFEGREMFYSVSVPHDLGPLKGLAVGVGSAAAAAKVLEKEHAKVPGAPLYIDARPGVVYEDVIAVVAAARRLEIPVHFVGRRGDK